MISFFRRFPRVLGVCVLSLSVSGLAVLPAQATSITSTVTGVVTVTRPGNLFGLFGVGDRIFAEVTYEDSLISPVGSSTLSIDTDPSFLFSVVAPTYRLDLPDFSQSISSANRSPELTFQDGAIDGITFQKESTRFDLPNNRPLTSFGTTFQSIEFHALTEFTIFLEGKWDFSNTGGGPPGNAPIPEPSTFLLLGSGIVGLVGWRWRKSRI